MISLTTKIIKKFPTERFNLYFVYFSILFYFSLKLHDLFWFISHFSIIIYWKFKRQKIKNIANDRKWISRGNFKWKECNCNIDNFNSILITSDNIKEWCIKWRITTQTATTEKALSSTIITGYRNGNWQCWWRMWKSSELIMIKLRNCVLWINSKRLLTQ